MTDLALEAAEHAAMRTQWSGLAAYGAVVREVGGWTALGCTELPRHPWLNQVVGSGPGLGDALDALAAAGVERAQVTLAGDVRRERVPAELVRRGFTAGPPLLRLVAPTGNSAPVTSLRLEVVGPDRADDVVAYDGDAPVAVGGLHVAGRTGWVGAAATVPHARRQGAQSALLAQRLRLAAEQGAVRVCVKAEPGSASARTLERLGFRTSHPLVPWSGSPQG